MANSWDNDPVVEQSGLGQFGSGNIDLTNRPKVRNSDGSISTVRSMSANFDGQEVLLPTVSDDGRIMTDDEAIDQYRKTGRFLGKFSTVDEANSYADRLHQEQEQMYADSSNPWDQDPIVDEGGQAPLEIDIVGGVRESDRAAQQATANPTDDMSGLDRFSAGVGKSLVDTYQGLKQSAVEGQPTGLAAINSGVLGLLQGRGFTESALGGLSELGQARQQMRQDTATRRELDRPLLDTGAGMSGNVLGTIAQLLGPGLAARGTAAAPALLPTTIGGNALQGAVIGSVQPAASTDERGVNALVGLAGGGGGAGVAKLGGATYNALAGLGRSGLSTADRGAAQVLMREAADPAALQRVAPSQVDGVQRTLAEETLDPGIARLERTSRSTGGQFDAIDRANNAARVRALETFAQDETALAAATRARNQDTKALREQAMQDRGVDVAAVRSVLDRQLESTATRPSVQSALLDVQRSLDEAGDDVFSLYGTRKYIDDLLSGKAGSDKSYAKAATKELMQIKGALDSKLADASPSFSQYLEKYRDMSGPINRMQVGQALTGRGSGGAVLDPVTGVQVLTPAQFSKASRSLDDVAAKATGFKKAKAADILRPGDIAIIKSIQDDLERQAFRATAGSGGNSQTFERLGVQDRIAKGAGREAMGLIPGGRYVGDLLDILDKSKNDQLKERLAYLLANPEEARRVLNALPPTGASAVRGALEQLAMTTGRSAQPATD